MLKYDYEEQSIFSTRLTHEVDIYLQINSVQFSIFENRVTSINGAMPIENCTKVQFEVPKPNCLDLNVSYFNLDDTDYGFSFRLNDEDWPTYMNESGWVCLGDLNVAEHLVVEVQAGCRLVFNDKQPKAAWFKIA